MDKINKNKRIIIISLMVVATIMVVFSIVNRFESYSFKNWVYDNYSEQVGSISKVLKMDKPGIITLIIAAAISIAMWGTFTGLSFKYSISKSPKVQGRKWPYIVMIIIAGVSALYGIYTVMQDYQGVIKFNAGVNANVQATITAKFNDSYGIIKIASILNVVFNAVITGISIIGLVFLIKAKNLKASQMTNEVIQTGIEENKIKDIEENDLP